MRFDSWKRPLSFSTGPVVAVTVAVYAVLIISLLYVQLIVPSAPSNPTPYHGINTTEAWVDLQHLTKHFHPFLSRENDELRNWLLQRVEDVLFDTGAAFHVEDGSLREQKGDPSDDESEVIVFNDLTSNISCTSRPTASASTYFEGTNIIIYIRGTEDGDVDWWRQLDVDPIDKDRRPRGVLVNAHYDSVATSFGATDDGMGIVSVLQLLQYYTTVGNTPNRGVVLLLNNGEEDYLNGARAFAQHPISQFVDTFLNLEGAGAGGRATMFRASDDLVVSFYKKSPHPFGNSLSADSFKRGTLSSQTDYIVFEDDLGLRGLDLAFMAPRSRYHTAEDSVRYTSKDALWHMLSAAIETTRGLSSASQEYIRSNRGTDAVWFDMFGKGLGMLALPSLFALSVALLVLCPLAVGSMIWVLRGNDKWYPFSRYYRTDPLDPQLPDDEMKVHLDGWRGFFRYPVAFVAASLATFLVAYVVAFSNPQMAQSSPYSIWTMCLTLWVSVAWTILRGADAARPSALARFYSFLWLFVGTWVVMIGVAVGQNKYQLTGMYGITISFGAVFVCFALSLGELYFLPSKEEYVRYAAAQLKHPFGRPTSAGHTGARPGSSSSGGVLSRYQHQHIVEGPVGATIQEEDQENEPASETTSLLHGRRSRKGSQSSRGIWSRTRTTSQSQSREQHSHEQSSTAEALSSSAVLTIPFPPQYGDEQAWSGSMPSSIWIVQFLVLAPISIILFGQLALFTIDALGNGLGEKVPGANTFYLGLALLSVLTVNPLAPFLHRFPRHVPFLLFCVFVGTFLYNILAFPFSVQHRLKFDFKQTLHIDTGLNEVSLSGYPGFIEKIAASMPSSAGQEVKCIATRDNRYPGLLDCVYSGPAPPLEPNPHSLPSTSIDAAGVNGTSSENSNGGFDESKKLSYKSWIKVEVTRHAPVRHNSSNSEDDNNGTIVHSATMKLRGKKTRACRITVPPETPFTDFHVHGSSTRNPILKMPVTGVAELRLWTRDWERGWTVDLYWNETVRAANTRFVREGAAEKGTRGGTGEGGSQGLAEDGLGEAGLGGAGVEAASVGAEVEKQDTRETRVQGLDMKIACLYSDANEAGNVPALDEVRAYMPAWAQVTKLDDGLIFAETDVLI